MQTTIDPTRTTFRETYTPGCTANSASFLSARTIESHASFVLPLLDRGLEVLDIGCGPGTITQGLAEYVLPGRVTAVDRDAVQVAHATRLAEGRELTNLRFTTGDVYELPFSTASFDLAFSHALFEQLSDPRTALREIRRVLRPGGFVALCSADWDSFELRKSTPEAEAALREYRDLQEARGGNTRAGGQLTRWLQECEFGFVRQGQRREHQESAMRVATMLSLQLDAAGRTKAARALLDWSAEPGAEFVGCWRHAIGIKWNR